MEKTVRRFSKILVTGGAGYVGAVLVPELLTKGYRVKVLDWFVYGDFLPENKNLEKIKGDIRNKKLLTYALADVEAVIHLACISNDPSFELDRNHSRSINYFATKQLVRLSLKAGIKRFVYASSSSVYGVKKEKEVTEDLSLAPLTDYSRYKALSEKYILEKASGNFTVLVLRPSTVCGFSPRMRFDLTVNLLTIQALVNKKITVFGGNQKRPNIHIKDMCEMYLKSLEYPDELINGKIYNVGGENYTVMQIAVMVKNTLNDWNMQITVFPSNDLRSYHVSSRKAFEDLGFKPKHTVEEAILDIKKEYDLGKFDRPIENEKYWNIKMMQKMKIS